MIETINKLIRTSRQLVQELGREPTSEEIAKRMDIPVAKVRKVLKIAQEPISLETPIGEEEDSHLGDFIEDRAVVSPAEAVINVNLKDQTGQVLRTLTPREEKVIKMRFGLEDGSEHTLEEVGQSFAVTRERIRQIEAKALKPWGEMRSFDFVVGRTRHFVSVQVKSPPSPNSELLMSAPCAAATSLIRPAPSTFSLPTSSTRTRGTSSPKKKPGTKGPSHSIPTPRRRSRRKYREAWHLLDPDVDAVKGHIDSIQSCAEEFSSDWIE